MPEFRESAGQDTCGNLPQVEGERRGIRQQRAPDLEPGRWTRGALASRQLLAAIDRALPVLLRRPRAARGGRDGSCGGLQPDARRCGGVTQHGRGCPSRVGKRWSNSETDHRSWRLTLMTSPDATPANDTRPVGTGWAPGKCPPICAGQRPLFAGPRAKTVAIRRGGIR
jgi:hypothetical protein